MEVHKGGIDMTREEKLTSKMREHRELLSEIECLRKQRQPIDNKLRKLNSKLHKLGQAIYDLKHSGMVPEVTDHAIVRYLQRVKGMNINDLKVEVAEHKQAVKQGNVIVTVNEEYKS